VTTDDDEDSEDGAIWLVEIADHIRSHRLAIDLPVGGAARWRDGLLAGRPAAGAWPVGRRARRSRNREPGRCRSRAFQRAHTGARIWRRRVDRVGWHPLLLQLRGRAAVPAGGWRRAGTAHPCPSCKARRVAICRRHRRRIAKSLDRRARRPHRRWRGRQYDRRGRPCRPGRRARLHSCRRSRLLLVAASVAGWTQPHLARLGSPQHAVERHHAVPRSAR
jgi:hypothetical protein